MNTVKFECEDRYEAEKLAGLLSVQKENTLYLDGIAAVVGNEIVIKLKDKSSHAVLLKDRKNVDQLKSFLLDVLNGKIKIDSSDFSGPIAEITFA